MKVKPKTKLKLSFDCNLGMWLVKGTSTRTDTERGLTFWDKVSAKTFKDTLETQDFHFYHNTFQVK